MNNNFYQKYKNVYFIGIGGISMSGLAEILKSKSLNVSGSDIKTSDITNKLESLGIKVNIGHSSNNITEELDLVIYTAAVKKDNPELLKAKKLNITTIDRAELLGYIMSEYQKSIAISGTHGKTTTTSMISEILLSANMNPTISVGGILPSIKGNTKIGNSEYFVAEACEYFDSFLKFTPFIGVILNIEEDHLDYFKNFENIKISFQKFAQKIKKEGNLVINNDIDNVNQITNNLNCSFITYSVKNKNANWFADNIVNHNDGKNSFDIYYNNKKLGNIILNIPGEHNISNALAACASTYSLGINFQNISNGLKNYYGTNRRFQKKGIYKGITIIDDYAHHPTEIKATLSAAQNIKHNKLWCIFQPHTYTRTYNLFNEFVNSFDFADNIIISDIYAARERDNGKVSAENLAKKIKEKGKNAIYIKELNDIKEYISKNCKKDDLLITMGAGDVYKIGEKLIQEN